MISSSMHAYLHPLERKKFNTFVFVTRQGGAGLMQLLPMRSPGEPRLRYKALLPADESATFEIVAPSAAP